MAPLAAALLFLATGCARTSAGPAGGYDPTAAPSGGPAAPSRAPVAKQAPADRTPAAPARAPAAPDPSEEMTPEELATIPDPVPPSAGGTAAAVAPVAPPASPGDDRAPQEGDARAAADDSAEASAGPSGTPPSPVPAGGPAWRVQILASPELAQADRALKEAAARLGVRGAIEFEDGLYKVRLGAFATEGEAQALRERAVREGYPGAFRVRTSGNASGDD